MKNCIYKKGDQVICKPGYNTEEIDHHDNGGGSGYEEGRVFIIHSITNGPAESFILWPQSTAHSDEDDGMGIYDHAVEYYDPIKRECNKIKIEIGL